MLPSVFLCSLLLQNCTHWTLYPLWNSWVSFHPSLKAFHSFPQSWGEGEEKNRSSFERYFTIKHLTYYSRKNKYVWPIWNPPPAKTQFSPAYKEVVVYTILPSHLSLQLGFLFFFILNKQKNKRKNPHTTKNIHFISPSLHLFPKCDQCLHP